MTENEQKLIELIRENDNPVQAMTQAIFIVLGYLKQEQSSSAQVPAYLRGLA